MAHIPFIHQGPRARYQYAHYRGMHHWLTTTERGKGLEVETKGDFNVGDLLTRDVIIPGDDDFKRILLEESVTFAACDGADHRVSYDHLTCATRRTRTSEASLPT